MPKPSTARDRRKTALPCGGTARQWHVALRSKAGPPACVTAWRYKIGPEYSRINPPDPRAPEGGIIELPARTQYEGPDGRWIPFFPLWRGLAANAVVWGSVVWVVLFGARVARGIIRRRRGLCLRCAYDRTGIPTAAVCPECGAAPVSTT